MQNTVPKIIDSIYPPVIVNLPTGRFAVISGSSNVDGWYPIGQKVSLASIQKRWSPKRYTEEPPLQDHWTWQVESSKKDSFYQVSFDKRGWSCSCVGFEFRRDCKHVRQIKTTI